MIYLKFCIIPVIKHIRNFASDFFILLHDDVILPDILPELRKGHLQVVGDLALALGFGSEEISADALIILAGQRNGNPLVILLADQIQGLRAAAVLDVSNVMPREQGSGLLGQFTINECAGKMIR